jgi:4'-phosphopantetheinyl transferase
MVALDMCRVPRLWFLILIILLAGEGGRRRPGPPASMPGMRLPRSGEVHVWSVALDLPAERVGALGGVLSEDELLRAARFKVEDGRRNFVVTRAALRVLLGRYLSADPSTLRFATTAAGKPRLDPLVTQFNVSHSGDAAMIAVTRDADVGVDIERITPRARLAGVARRVFTPAEREAIDGDEAFYRHWVAKEAFVKATGRGVASVKSFEVLLDAPGGARLVHVGGDAEEATRWTLTPVDARPGYAAALVVRGQATVTSRTFGP